MTRYEDDERHSRKQQRRIIWLLVILVVAVLFLVLTGQDDYHHGQQVQIVENEVLLQAMNDLYRLSLEHDESRERFNTLMTNLLVAYKSDNWRVVKAYEEHLKLRYDQERNP